MPESSTTIITGMNRSGTSLVASMFQRAGLNIGQKMVPTNQGNVHGYFEDTDFVNFHATALMTRGRYVGAEAFDFQPHAMEIEAARQLIAVRSHLPFWGWKDPSTCLFLDFWKGLLPDARFLFVYRHPLDVLISIIRRHGEPMPDLMDGLKFWRVYNLAFLNFSQRHPGDCIIANIYALVNAVERLNELVEKKFAFNLGLTTALRDSLFHPKEFRQYIFTGPTSELFSSLAPETAELYRRLQEIADMPLIPKPSSAASDPASEMFCGLALKILALNQKAYARGALHMLISHLEPTLIDNFYDDFTRSLNEGGKRSRWINQQRLNWMNIAKMGAEIIAKQKKGGE